MSQSSSLTFFDLPSELRIQVYIHATVNNYVSISTSSRRKRNLGLLQTNRQMRQEARAIYYQNSKFRGDENSLIDWISSLDRPTRAQIRRLYVHVPIGEGDKISGILTQRRLDGLRRDTRGLSPECYIDAYFVPKCENPETALRSR